MDNFDKAYEVFLKDNKDKFIYPDDSNKLNICFDNYEDIKEYLKDGAYVATIVEDEESLWIIEGLHIVNRVGYILFKSKPIFRDEDIRYW